MAKTSNSKAPVPNTAPTPVVSSRHPMLFIVCGETGVGKTFRNRLVINRYLKEHTKGGKKPRKVLVFDTNDHDYPTFQTVDPKYLHRLRAIKPRRIRPINPDGSPMNQTQKKDVVVQMLKHFREGLLVLDDIDNYMSGEKGRDMISALCTLRHKNVDLLLTHQSLSKITRTEWENCTYLRLHHQVDDVTYYRRRVPKYPIVRVAQLIVDQQYQIAFEQFSNGSINEATFKRLQGYFVYVNMRTQRIYGCTKPAFIRATKKFIDQELGRTLKMMLEERDLKNKRIYPNRTKAIYALINQYIRYHHGNSLSS